MVIDDIKRFDNDIDKELNNPLVGFVFSNKPLVLIGHYNLPRAPTSGECNGVSKLGSLGENRNSAQVGSIGLSRLVCASHLISLKPIDND